MNDIIERFLAALGAWTGAEAYPQLLTAGLPSLPHEVPHCAQPKALLFDVSTHMWRSTHLLARPAVRVPTSTTAPAEGRS